VATDPERPDGWGVIGDWQSYFNDPAVDRLVEMVTDLAATTWTLMDRQRILEWELQRRGHLDSGRIDTYQPTEEEERQLTEQRNAFMSRLLSSLTRKID